MVFSRTKRFRPSPSRAAVAPAAPPAVGTPKPDVGPAALVERLERRSLMSVAVSWAVEAATFGSVYWQGIEAENTANAPTSYRSDTKGQPGLSGSTFPAPADKTFAGFASSGSVAYDGGRAESSVSGQFATSVERTAGGDAYTLEASGTYAATAAYSASFRTPPQGIHVSAYYQAVMTLTLTVTGEPATVRVSGTPSPTTLQPGVHRFAASSGDAAILSGRMGGVTKGGPFAGRVTVTVETAPDQPDLVATLGPVRPSGRAVPGGRAAATLQVSNGGLADATGMLRTALYLSADGVLDASDVLLKTHAQAIALAAGRSAPVQNVSFTLPLGTAPGSYQLIAKVDAAGAFAESDEGNNVAPGRTFRVVEPPRVVDPVGPARPRAGRHDVRAALLGSPDSLFL